MKKIASSLCVLFLLTGCTQISDEEKEFNDSGRAKAIEHEEDLWQYFMDEETGLSFKYPNNVHMEDAQGGDIKLSVVVEPIATLDDTMGYNSETAKLNQIALSSGAYGENVDFPLEASKEVVSVENTYAQQFMVLGRFEVCDVTFERKLYFFHNDNQIVITLSGPRYAIVQSMSEYFTTDPENCFEETIWDFDKQADFYLALENDQGSEVAQEWFDSFERIKNTIEFDNALDDVRSKLQGVWIDTEDELSSVSFIDDYKLDSYDNESQGSVPFLLEDASDGPQIVAGEGDGKEVFAIIEITEDSLKLLHLPRGNLLNYKR
ncbi:MAG: hypothetical protein K9M03_02345 [Kiritimatiellales bacterium]|nr:hypothetical protein [Kiritimatiellales bacterium]